MARMQKADGMVGALRLYLQGKKSSNTFLMEFMNANILKEDGVWKIQKDVVRPAFPGYPQGRLGAA